jgi:hypothetical protein
MTTQKMTKRQLVERVVDRIEGWLDHKEVLDVKTIGQLRLLHGIDTNRLVAGIEKFILPAFESDSLENYVKAELEKAQFFSYKLRGASEDPVIQAKLANAAKQLRTLTPADVYWLCQRLTIVCKILKS